MSNDCYFLKKTATSINIDNSMIKEVYSVNFESEFDKISALLEEFPIISMDTEFPGTIFNRNTDPDLCHYGMIRKNINALKLIQVGITLSNSEGLYPSETCTWQFYLKFNRKKDLLNEESISMLEESGVNFEICKSKGIDILDFGEYLFSSGLLLNEKLTWITFHGIYDFGYLLKYSTNEDLALDSDSFLSDLALFFPNYYDIKFLCEITDLYQGSLNKLATELKITRIGSQHQAGSDSLVTSMVYIKLKKILFEKKHNLENMKNFLFLLNNYSSSNHNSQNVSFISSSTQNKKKEKKNKINSNTISKSINDIQAQPILNDIAENINDINSTSNFNNNFYDYNLQEQILLQQYNNYVQVPFIQQHLLQPQQQYNIPFQHPQQIYMQQQQFPQEFSNNIYIGGNPNQYQDQMSNYSPYFAQSQPQFQSSYQPQYNSLGMNFNEPQNNMHFNSFNYQKKKEAERFSDGSVESIKSLKTKSTSDNSEY